MPILFSRACEYALWALAEMARYPGQKFWSVFKLANHLNVPAPFLAKTFQLLVKRGILISSKGRIGGYTFAKSPDKIPLIKVIEAIDDLELVQNCALGLPQCSDTNPCPFHPYWGKAREIIVEALNNETIAQLAQQDK